MGSFLLYLQNEVTFRTNSPTAAQIEGALQTIPLVAARASRRAAGLLDNGGFIGSPRIVRRTNALPPGGRLTDVVWLYSWDPRTNATAEADAAREIQDYIRAQADLVLRTDDGWKPAQILPYDPAVNGSVEWWSNGTASQTITKDAFDLNEQLGSNRSVENVLGPVTIRPPDLANPFGFLLDLAPWVVGGLALWFIGGPIVSAVTARKNPSSKLSPRQIVALRQWDEWAAMPRAKRLVSIRSFSLEDLIRILESNDPNGDYRSRPGYDGVDKDEAVEIMNDTIEREL